MKVLVLDDSPRRHKTLRDRLNDLSDEMELVIVTSCMDARRELEGSVYDLFIIDIIVPLRPEDDPNSRNARDLLDEIHDEDELRKPRKILGLTADPAAAEDLAEFFETHTWRLIRYQEDNDSWLQQIVNCVLYLCKVSPSDEASAFDYDVAIICALKDPELLAVRRLDWSWSELKPLDDNVFVYEGRFISGGRSFRVVAGYCSKMGVVAGAVDSARLIEAARPRLIVMTGICAGVPGKTKIGTAVLAEPAWDWQSGKIGGGKGADKLAVSPHQICVDQTVRSKFDALVQDLAFSRFVQDGWPGARQDEFVLAVGPMASGSAVIADEKTVSDIRKHNRDLLAIDMEAYGLYLAASAAARPKPMAIAVKSVCDFANSEKDDQYQAYAAYTSAQTVREFLERFYSKM